MWKGVAVGVVLMASAVGSLTLGVLWFLDWSSGAYEEIRTYQYLEFETILTINPEFRAQIEPYVKPSGFVNNKTFERLRVMDSRKQKAVWEEAEQKDLSKKRAHLDMLLRPTTLENTGKRIGQAIEQLKDQLDKDKHETDPKHLQ